VYTNSFLNAIKVKLEFAVLLTCLADFLLKTRLHTKLTGSRTYRSVKDLVTVLVWDWPWLKPRLPWYMCWGKSSLRNVTKQR